MALRIICVKEYRKISEYKDTEIGNLKTNIGFLGQSRYIVRSALKGITDRHCLQDMTRLRNGNGILSLYRKLKTTGNIKYQLASEFVQIMTQNWCVLNRI